MDDNSTDTIKIRIRMEIERPHTDYSCIYEKRLNTSEECIASWLASMVGEGLNAMASEFNSVDVHCLMNTLDDIPGHYDAIRRLENVNCDYLDGYADFPEAINQKELSIVIDLDRMFPYFSDEAFGKDEDPDKEHRKQKRRREMLRAWCHIYGLDFVHFVDNNPEPPKSDAKSAVKPAK